MSMILPVTFSSPMMSLSRTSCSSGNQRRQVFKKNSMLELFRRKPVYRIDFYQSKVTFSVLWRSDFSFDGITGMQVKTSEFGTEKCRCRQDWPDKKIRGNEGIQNRQGGLLKFRLRKFAHRLWLFFSGWQTLILVCACGWRCQRQAQEPYLTIQIRVWL